MLSNKKSVHVMQSDMHSAKVVLLFGLAPKQLIIYVELIFLGASDEVKCLDIGKQVKAQEFTQAVKKYVFRCSTTSFHYSQFRRGRECQNN